MRLGLCHCRIINHADSQINEEYRKGETALEKTMPYYNASSLKIISPHRCLGTILVVAMSQADLNSHCVVATGIDSQRPLRGILTMPDAS